MKTAETLLHYMDLLQKFAHTINSYVEKGLDFLHQAKAWVEKALEYLEKAIDALVQRVGGRKSDTKLMGDDHLFV